VVIGVPNCQDTRVGRTTCMACGEHNPPWGHVNTFNYEDLCNIFNKFNPINKSYVWTNSLRTNGVSTWLMDLAGNPWGDYSVDEPCVRCGARLVPPPPPSPIQRGLASMSFRIRRVQALWVRPSPNWIHVVFSKRNPSR
jgi:hypothetical protein